MTTRINHRERALALINEADDAREADALDEADFKLRAADIHARLAIAGEQRNANLIEVLDNAARLVASGNSHAADYIALHQRINPLVMEGLGL